MYDVNITLSRKDFIKREGIKDDLTLIYKKVGELYPDLDPTVMGPEIRLYGEGTLEQVKAWSEIPSATTVANEHRILFRRVGSRVTTKWKSK